MNHDVAVLGLGLMGRALAGAFLRDGHPTTVWNRTAEKAGDLVGQGARLAASPGEAVAAAPLAVMCVSDHDAVLGLLDRLGDDLGGRVLVNLTSGTPAAAREVAGRVTRRGGAYLDGAIMAVPQAIGTPDAAVLYSGSREAFDRYEPVLKSLSPEPAHLGEDPGLAGLHEVAVLSLMWNVLNGFLHGTALLGASGVAAAAFAPIARRGIEITAGWLPGYARQIDDGAYPATDATIDTHLAATRPLIEESEALGVAAELPRFVKDLMDRAVADGHGGSGYAAMIKQFRRG